MLKITITVGLTGMSIAPEDDEGKPIDLFYLLLVLQSATGKIVQDIQNTSKIMMPNNLKGRT